MCALVHCVLQHRVFFGEVAEWSKALDWNSSYARKGIRGFESHPLRQFVPGRAAPAPRHRLRSMVARVGSSATVYREPRQARKGATVTAIPGAGGSPARPGLPTGRHRRMGSRDFIDAVANLGSIFQRSGAAAAQPGPANSARAVSLPAAPPEPAGIRRALSVPKPITRLSPP